MKGLLLVFVLSSVLLAVQSASTVATCKTSYECGKGSCCRDEKQRVLSNQSGGFIHMLVDQKGSCTVGKAQKGEVCDSVCDCDTGFKCYRPMSGVCCIPSTCHDEDYVIKQQAYWSNCMNNPNCALPP